MPVAIICPACSGLVMGIYVNVEHDDMAGGWRVWTSEGDEVFDRWFQTGVTTQQLERAKRDVALRAIMRQAIYEIDGDALECWLETGEGDPWAAMGILR